MSNDLRRGSGTVAEKTNRESWLMRKRRAHGSAILAMTLALVGCGSSGSSTSPATAPSGVSTSTSAAASGGSTAAAATTSKTASSSRTASQVVGEFIARGIPVTGVITYDATTDPNHLLGRPNGYSSKASWVDSRIHPSQVSDSSKGSVGAGGSVEIYPTPSGADARGKYIAGIAARLPIVNEYDFVAGDALLRLSSVLTPAQADGYASVIGATLVKAG